MYLTEKKLRKEIRYNHDDDKLKLGALCSLGGLLAVFSLSSFVVLVGCIIIRRAFRDVSIENRRSLLNPRVWWLILSLIFFGTVVLTNCLAALGVNNQVGLISMDEPGPWLSPRAQDVLMSVFFVGALTALGLAFEYEQRLRTRSLPKISLFTVAFFTAEVYLVSILLMACFRSYLVYQMIAQPS